MYFASSSSVRPLWNVQIYPRMTREGFLKILALHIDHRGTPYAHAGQPKTTYNNAYIIIFIGSLKGLRASEWTYSHILFGCYESALACAMPALKMSACMLSAFCAHAAGNIIVRICSENSLKMCVTDSMKTLNWLSHSHGRTWAHRDFHSNARSTEMRITYRNMQNHLNFHWLNGTKIISQCEQETHSQRNTTVFGNPFLSSRCDKWSNGSRSWKCTKFGLNTWQGKHPTFTVLERLSTALSQEKSGVSLRACVSSVHWLMFNWWMPRRDIIADKYKFRPDSACSRSEPGQIFPVLLARLNDN